MDRGMGIVHVVMNIHVHIVVCPEFLQWSNDHHPTKRFGNPLPFLLLPGLYGHQDCAWKIVHVDQLHDAVLVAYYKAKRLLVL